MLPARRSIVSIRRGLLKTVSTFVADVNVSCKLQPAVRPDGLVILHLVLLRQTSRHLKGILILALSFTCGPNHGGNHANGAIPHMAHVVVVVEPECVVQAIGVTI